MPTSGLYEGWVSHRRRTPVEHEFRYRIFLAYLDLDELPDLFRGRWLWGYERRRPATFRRADYLGDPNVPLADAVRDVVRTRTGRAVDGPIRLLTHLRYFGYCFNPVSFYYCFDAAGERVDAIVAEITNTPWKERRAYVLDRRGAEAGEVVPGAAGLRFRFAKDFHVSPFLPMELDYDWRFTPPGARLAVQMNLTDRRGRTFEATLRMERREITPWRLRWLLLRRPVLTLQVIAKIHWEALRLWLKRVPVHTHPAELARRAETRP